MNADHKPVKRVYRNVADLGSVRNSIYRKLSVLMKNVILFGESGVEMRGGTRHLSVMNTIIIVIFLNNFDPITIFSNTYIHSHLTK